MRVLLTGATGFVGGNIARSLLAAGHDVRAAMRSSSSTLGLDDLSVERVSLDLEDPKSADAAVAGCDGLVHAAAGVWIGRTGRDWMERVNVGGTDNVLRAAANAGVQRVVHVSSCDALGIRTREQPADEDVLPNMEWLDCAYVDTKRAAEEVVATLRRRRAPRRDRQPGLHARPLGHPADLRNDASRDCSGQDALRARWWQLLPRCPGCRDRHGGRTGAGQERSAVHPGRREPDVLRGLDALCAHHRRTCAHHDRPAFRRVAGGARVGRSGAAWSAGNRM